MKTAPRTAKAASKDYLAIANEYIGRVVRGEELVCRKVRQTIDRHVRDLSDSASGEGDFFFTEAGARVCRLFERVRPSKWPTTMSMAPWMVACTMILYGWKHRETVDIGATGKSVLVYPRRFRQAFLMWPRKMGKSAYLSVLALNALAADGERGAEVYSAALVEEQARRVFDEAVAMRDGTPFLRAAIKKLGDSPCRRLRVPETNSEFRPLSRDKESMEGLNISFAAGDEVHKWTGRGAWDVLRYGMRSRVQPLLVGITTAPSADDSTSICNTLYEYSRKVLEGTIPDERFFCWITELDGELKSANGDVLAPADDWRDESAWIKACPNLGVTVRLEDMRQEALEASNDAASLNAFMRYSLNIRVDAVDQPIPTADWNRCGRPGDPVELRKASSERLAGRICFAGLDLALTDDTSALALTFPPAAENEKWEFLLYFWIPADNIEARVRTQQVPYDVWRNQGFLITTPGRVTDHSFIAGHIRDLEKQFDLRELAYDPALANGLVKILLENRVVDGKKMPGMKREKVVKFAQTALNYAAPCGDFVRAVAREEIVHDSDPVLRWQVTNLRWKKNHTGLVMPDKERSIEKIDGVVAAIMAYGRATHPDNAQLLKVRPKVIQL